MVNEALDRWVQGLPINAQFRDELRRFAGGRAALLRAPVLVLGVGVALLATWPASAVLELGRVPVTYRAVGGVAVLAVAYLALIGGLLAQPGQGRFTAQQWAKYVPLAPYSYLGGALAGRMLEPLLLILLAWPLIVAGAMVEGAALWQLAAVLLVLLVTALCFGLFALTLTLWLEPRRGALLAVGHAVLIAMFALGEWAWLPLSPWSAFLGTLGEGTAGALGWFGAGWPGFLMTQAALAGGLFALAWWRIVRLRRDADTPATNAAD